MPLRLRRTVLATAPAVALLVAGIGAVPAVAVTSATGTTTPAPSPSPSGTSAPTGTITPTPTPSPTLTPTPTPTPTPSPTLTPTPTPTPTPPPMPYPTGSVLDHTAGRTANTRTVWLTGTHLDNVATVLIDGVATTRLTPVSPTRLGFVIGTSPDFQPDTAAISLVAADGAVQPTSLTFSWVVQNRVDRQMQYAFRNWNAYASARYGYLPGNDCANFTSQTLRARGWTAGASWYNKGQGDWTSTWVSSTAMSNWLRTRPDLATRLLYRQRDDVRVGDIVQFNYEGVGTWWDHTGIVSKVVVLPSGRHDVYYVAHTNNTRYGGSTQYLAQHRKLLRIQFWRLNK